MLPNDWMDQGATWHDGRPVSLLVASAYTPVILGLLPIAAGAPAVDIELYCSSSCSWKLEVAAEGRYLSLSE